MYSLVEYISTLDSLLIELTTDCNKKCNFCYNRYLEKQHLNLNLLKKVEDLISKYGVKSVTFSGGEPLISPDFLEILNFFNSRVENIVIITNGLLISDELLLTLMNYRDKITFKISVDLSDSSHIESISSKFNNYKFRYILAITLYDNTPEDIDSFLKRIRLIYSKPIEVSFSIFKGNAKISQNKIDDAKKCLKYLVDVSIENNDKILCEHTTFAMREYFSKSTKVVSNCSICKSIKCDINGNLFACPYFTEKEYIIGDIFSGIDQEKSLFCLSSYISLRERETCKHCKWKNLCNGGCLVTAKECMTSIDSSCVYHKYVFDYLESIFGYYT